MFLTSPSWGVFLSGSLCRNQGGGDLWLLANSAVQLLAFIPFEVDNAGIFPGRGRSAIARIASEGKSVRLTPTKRNKP